MAWSVELENIHSKKEKITLEELKQIELNMLKAFDAFCRENDLRYFLAGGTLLGAVRHQGFIPWDDDIDVLMPRPDYIKFLEMTKGKPLHGYTVRSIQTHPEVHTRPFIRIVDDRYMTSLSTAPFYMPPWIDIFPMDGLPDGMDTCKKYFADAKKLKWIIARSWQPMKYTTKNKLKAAVKTVLYTPLRLVGHNHYLRKLEAFGMQYDFETSEYVGCVVAGGHGVRERVKRDVFCRPVLMRFEDAMFIGPAGYHQYLSQLYGENYMQIPKKIQQTHLKEAWRIREQTEKEEEK